jgi:hypothetical protein
MLVLNILIFIAVLVVAGILLAGLFALQRGGEFGRKWSNRLMRYRILSQAVAVILILIAVLIFKHHQG